MKIMNPRRGHTTKRSRASSKTTSLNSLSSEAQKASLLSYTDLLKRLKERFIIKPIRDFGGEIASKTIYLRHDIDHDIECAYEMALAESKMGVRSTYYVLTTDTATHWWADRNRRESGLKMLLEMQEMGHEIGLHYDVMGDWFASDIKAPEEGFVAALDALRRSGLRITTCAAHGSGRMNRLLSYGAGGLPYEIKRELNGYKVWRSSYCEQALIRVGKKTLKTHSMCLDDYKLTCEAYITLGTLNDIYASDVRVGRGIGISITRLSDLKREVVADDFAEKVANSFDKNTKDKAVIQLSIHPHHWRRKKVMSKDICFGQAVKATAYDRFYLDGGFGYCQKKMKSMLQKNTSLFDKQASAKKKTLLDVGCGDGFWANILSDHFDVTAEDPSLGGVLMGSSKDKEGRVTWLCGDSASLLSIHDVVFARCPSFFNKPVNDAGFIKSFEHIWKRVGEKLYFIVSSTEPFSRQKGGSYMHDPALLKEFCKKYGKTSVSYKDGYIWCEVSRGEHD